MPETHRPYIPPRGTLETLVLPAMRKMPEGEHPRKAVIAKAIEHGEFSDEQKRVPCISKRHSEELGMSQLEYDLGHSLSALKKKGLLENPRHGYWKLPER